MILLMCANPVFLLCHAVLGHCYHTLCVMEQLSCATTFPFVTSMYIRYYCKPGALQHLVAYVRLVHLWLLLCSCSIILFLYSTFTLS